MIQIKFGQIAIAFVAGLIVGRRSKTCSMTIAPDEPMPSARALVALAMAGNQDALDWIEFVSEKARKGDKEAQGHADDIEDSWVVAKARQEAMALQEERPQAA